MSNIKNELHWERKGGASAPTHHRICPRPYSGRIFYRVGAGEVGKGGGGACAAPGLLPQMIRQSHYVQCVAGWVFDGEGATEWLIL